MSTWPTPESPLVVPPGVYAMLRQDQSEQLAYYRDLMSRSALVALKSLESREGVTPGGMVWRG